MITTPWLIAMAIGLVAVMIAEGARYRSAKAIGRLAWPHLMIVLASGLAEVAVVSWPDLGLLVQVCLMASGLFFVTARIAIQRQKRVGVAAR